MKPNEPSVDVAAARAAIREAGLRGTAARIAVYQRLAAASHPLSHADVVDELATQGFDRATIYRNLVELAECGLASRVDLGDHVWRFELRRDVSGHEAGEHPHFVCVDCGEVSCLPPSAVSVQTQSGARKSGIRDITEVVLKGHCNRCG